MAVREEMFCRNCNSTWRVRASALGVLVGSGIPQAPFPEVKADWSRRSVGLSDHVALSSTLSARFSYTNTYYHQFPRLDLLGITPDQKNQFAFVICSDVLEHVPPPADLALVGIRNLLLESGFAILSVPSGGLTAATKEFYPDLISWKESSGRITWVDSSGIEHLDDNPEFHGGGGQTLAFRLWGMQDFCTRVTTAGFKIVAEIPTNADLGIPPIDNHGMYIAYAG